MTAEKESVSTTAPPPAAAGGVDRATVGSGDGQSGNSALGIVGSRVREERLAQRIGVRELARRVGVSASLISQVELGKASPSVGTLYAIVNELGLSLDELFFRHPPAGESGNVASAATVASRSEREPDGVPSANVAPLGERRADASETTTVARGGGGDSQAPLRPEPRPTADPGAQGPTHTHSHGPSWSVEPVVRRGTGQVIQLATGVEWQRLAPPTPQDVDFLQVAYHPGSESCPPDSLMRHSGHEYGHIISGRMGVTIGFETYELAPGDSIAFDSTMPHRLFAIGDETVEAIWVVVGRRGAPSAGTAL